MAAATTLLVAAGLVVVGYSGGSYDLVTRQTAAVVVWWAVGVGALVVFPAPRRPPLSGVAVTAFAVAIAVWIALNLGDSVSQERSVAELGRAVLHVGPIVLIGWVLPRHLWKPVFAGLVLGAISVSTISLTARLSPGVFGEASSSLLGNSGTRLSFPFGYWNAVGSWAVMTSMLLLAVSVHSGSRVVRSLCLGAMPIATTVGYMTYSRSALGAVAVGVVVLVALSKHRWTAAVHVLAVTLASAATIRAVRGAPEIADATGSAGARAVVVALGLAFVALAVVAASTGHWSLDRVKLPRKAGLIAFAAGVAVALVASGVAIDRYGQEAWDQFSTTKNINDPDPTKRLTTLNGSRLEQWRAAVDAYKQDPLHGTGAGTFEFTYNRVSDREFVRDAHNAFVETLSEQGAPGLALLVGLLLSIAVTIVSAAARAQSALDRGLLAGAGGAIAAFVVGTSVDWFWEVSALAMLVMGLAGVAIAAARPPASDKAPRSGGIRWRALVVLVAAVAVIVELPALVGTSDVRQSGRAVSAGDLGRARAYADSAIETMPWASSPFLQRALVDEQAGRWRAARASLALASERDPKDWRIPLVLARVEARSGRPKQAIAAYRQARELRPNGVFFK